MRKKEADLIASFDRGTLTRRQLLQGLAAVPIAAVTRATAQVTRNADVAYGQTTIPAGIRSRSTEYSRTGFQGGLQSYRLAEMPDTPRSSS